MKEGTLPSREIELKLIETLRTITEGKIYVEVERARLTHRLSSMQEEDGDLNSAAKTMQELQVGCLINAGEVRVAKLGERHLLLMLHSCRSCQGPDSIGV